MVGRILVRLPNWLGDLLMSRPLLHALRARLEDGELWAIGTPAARLLDREGLWTRRLPVTGAAAGRGALQGHRFDAAIILPPSFSSAWALRRLDVARRIGFASDLRSWLLTDPMRRPARGDRHLSDEYLALGERLGVNRTSLPELAPTAEERAAALARLRALGGENRPVAILGPGAAYGAAKRWPVERFAALGRRLVARGHLVLTAGTASDQGQAAAVAGAIGEGAHDLAGMTSVEEMLALCAGARVVVSNDSGLAHLAAASGAPTIVVFGSTSSAWTTPLGPRVTAVHRAPVCSPCFRRTCRIGYRCLEAIEVDVVERACAEAAA